jgi:hypothetical protein
MWGTPVRPPRHLSQLVRYVVSVDIVQVTSLDLVRLLEEGGHREQDCAKHGSDGGE